MRNRHSAFTLVELLVVIAIIVILISILVPSLERAMGVAQAAQCAGNQHALGVGFGAYTLDSAQALPDPRKFGANRPAYDDNNHSWHRDANGRTGIEPVPGDPNYPGGQLYPYASSEKMFFCPTFPGLFGHPDAQGHFNGGTPVNTPHSPLEREPGLAFAANAAITVGWDNLLLLKTNGPWEDRSGNGNSWSVRPADTFLLGEENLWPNRPWGGWPRNDSALAISRWLNPGNVVDGFGNYHPGGGSERPSGAINVLMFDGHVERAHASEAKRLAYPHKSMFLDAS